MSYNLHNLWQFFAIVPLSGFCYKHVEKAMLWRIVVSVAIVEVLFCVLPIELAGIITILRLWLSGG